jgi:glycolate oxidase FAD binding subunit
MAAAAGGETLRIRAGGSWLHAGRPTRTDRFLDLSALAGITDYVPGDLTLTAHAATPLAAIDAATREHNQWLPLDAFGDARGTIGATLATASAGPLGATIGLPRDVALGLGIVTGRGEEIRAGGRVVKNVAGYDLVRLQVGAWGTLGVLTEVTVRLRGRPASDLSLAIPLPGDRPALAAFLASLRTSASPALAAELLSSSLASRLGLGTEACLLLRIAGNETQVAAQRAAFESSGACAVLESSQIWSRLRSSEPDIGTVYRVSGRPSTLAAIWHEVNTTAGLWCHASVERGIVRCCSDHSEADLSAELARLAANHRVVVERAPGAIWSASPSTSPSPLEDGMRRAFDPEGVLNPGMLGMTS